MIREGVPLLRREEFAFGLVSRLDREIRIHRAILSEVAWSSPLFYKKTPLPLSTTTWLPAF